MISTEFLAAGNLSRIFRSGAPICLTFLSGPPTVTGKSIYLGMFLCVFSVTFLEIFLEKEFGSVVEWWSEGVVIK